MISPNDLNHPIIDQFLVNEMSENQFDKETRFKAWYAYIHITANSQIPYQEVKEAWFYWDKQMTAELVSRVAEKNQGNDLLK